MMREAGPQRQSRDAPRPPPPPPPSITSRPPPSSSSSSGLPFPPAPLPLQASSPVVSSPGRDAGRHPPETCGVSFGEDAAVVVAGEWHDHPDSQIEVGLGAAFPSRGGVTTCQQCPGTSRCQAPHLHILPPLSEAFARDSSPGSETLFPDSVSHSNNNDLDTPGQDVATSPHKSSSSSSLLLSSSPSPSPLSSSSSSSSSSSWISCGHRDRGTWTRPMCGERRGAASAAKRLPCQRSLGFRGQGVMGRVSIRRCRQWLGLGLPLAAFVYILVSCNSALWSSLHLQHTPLLNTLSGSGFRKLLEEQEKGRLSVNMSRGAGQLQRLPSCIIIGVRKCGTRALLEFLDLHPDIVTAEDEMHFFNDDERYKLGLEWYRHLMPPSLPHQITMEKTPGYFISPIAPSRVHRMNSTVKLIVLLRHPTTRTISDYTQIFYNKLSKNESLDAFEDIAIDRDTDGVNTHYKAVQISMYHHHFRHWTDVFPKHQIHVVDGDRLITDPVSEIREIETFLGLPHRIDYSILYFNSTRGFYCMHVNATYEKCLGASKGRKHPDIQLPVIRKMNKFFQPHNRELFDLIGRKFPWS